MLLIRGRFDPSHVCHAMFDNDNTLVDYKQGEAEGFSYYTAVYAKRKAQELLRNPSNLDINIVLKLQELRDTPEFDLRDACIRAYKRDGTTTEWLRAYGLDPYDLYCGHHDLIVEEVINGPQYTAEDDPSVHEAISGLKEVGISTGVFTNGTTLYAEAKLREARLRDCFNNIVGIEQLAEKRHLTFKHQRATWIKFLEKLKIPSVTGYVIGQTDRVRALQDTDWSNCIFIDDDPRVLAVAKEFGFQTVLKVTDRVDWKDYRDCDFVDAITDDLSYLCQYIISCKRRWSQKHSRTMVV